MKFKFFLLSLFSTLISCQAVSDVVGGIPVRLPGKNEVCINTDQHKISLHLRRFLVGKDEGWFKKDKEVGLLLETSISKDDWVSGLTDEKTFPKLFKSDISKYRKGIVSIPVEEKLFHNFDLKTDTAIYDSVEVSFTVLKKKKKANFGVALEQLDQVSKSIPASIDPFSSSFKFFANYANSVVSESLDEKNNVDSALSDAKLVLSFSTDGVCSEDEEKTGIIAVVKSSNHKTSNTIDIADLPKFCLRGKYRPSFSLEYASRQADGTCPNSDSDYSTLHNPYTLFVLNAAKSNRRSAVASSSIDDVMELGNSERCSLLGISAEDCI